MFASFWIRRLVFMAALTSLAVTGFAQGEPFDYEKEYIACVEQWAYSDGGALVGDCFNDQARALDAEIATSLNRATKRFCTDEARAALSAAQAAWATHRETFCRLISASPGNTPSWILGGACRLDLTRKRLEVLRYYLDDAHMWCLPMGFAPAMSHFGDPTGISRSSDDPVFSWEGLQDATSTALQITGATGGSHALDTTGCQYCDSGADCSDGVFALLDRTTSAQSTSDDGFGRAAILHACHMKDGTARIDVVGDLSDGPALSETLTGKESIDWKIDRGRLRVVIDGDTLQPHYWPPGRDAQN